jgi:hypothetical protein
MSNSHDHAQLIADDIAINKYGHLFKDLPKSEQENIFRIAQILADKEIKDLTGSI